MKIIKKNQLTILVIALMLVTAGYLNYTTYNENAVETSSNSIILEQENLAGIGDAKLVNSEDIVDNSISNIEENTQKNIANAKEDKNMENINEENILMTSSNTNTDEYFIKSRLERETMYSQMIASYQKILESSSISDEQKEISGQEINNINKTKNAIMISENLIKNKGFEECIIFVNDKSVNIIVRKEEVKPDEIAQIQNIVTRELGVEVENIHISNK